MADADQLKLIEQGIDVWNRWRSEHPEINPDLSQAYLYETDLSGANLSHANLNRVCLIGANLKEVNFRGANLNSAYISTANLSAADFSEANLQEANFSEANLSNANFYQAHVRATNFTSATLTGICVEGWQIDANTVFEGVICQYFYWRRQQQDRFPRAGEFAFTDFTKLIREHSTWAEPEVGEPEIVKSEIVEFVHPPSPSRRATVITPSTPSLPNNDDLASNLLTIPKPPTIAKPSNPRSAPKVGQQPETAKTRSPKSSAIQLSKQPATARVANAPAAQTITIHASATDATPARRASVSQLQPALPQGALLLMGSQPELETDGAVRWFIMSLACVGIGAAIALAAIWATSQWTSKPAAAPVLYEHSVDRTTQSREGT